MAEAKQAPIRYDYVDRPEVAEVFADFVQRIQFDGQTLRFEFCVSRLGRSTAVRARDRQALPGLPTCTVSSGRCRSYEQDAADHCEPGQGRSAEGGSQGA